MLLFSVLSVVIGGSLAVADEDVSLRVSALSKDLYIRLSHSIHCVDWLDDFVLCPLTISNNKIEYSNFTSISNDALEYKMRVDSADFVVPSRYQKKSADGKEGAYWASGMMDGYDAAGWLHPKKLEEIAGYFCWLYSLDVVCFVFG